MVLKYITPKMDPQERQPRNSVGSVGSQHLMKMLHDLEQWWSQ